MTIDTLPISAVDARPGRGQRLARDALFIVSFLLVWLTVEPFANLGDAGLVAAVNDGNLLGQVAALALTAGMALFIAQHQPHLLAKAVSPILILTFAWFALSAFGSDHSALALRRLVLAAMTIFQATVFLLLAPTREDFARLLAICAFIVLALCYAGVVLLPGLSIHQFSDIREPELAGAWRGAFSHKNGAGAAMVVLIFVGLFVARVRGRTSGFLIVGLATVFLIGTKAKAPLQLLPVVLLAFWLASRIRQSSAAVGTLLAAPVFIMVLTIGSVLVDPIRSLLYHLLSDPSFTGRDVIWEFALDQTAERPFLGFGYQAFWGTRELVGHWSPQESWGYRASDAHNSFLDLSVMTGIVGMALATIWIVVQPLVDYVRSRSHEVDPALTALFMQIWLFGLCLSGFESIYFSGGSAIWFMVVVAIMGLRFQNVFPLRR